MEHETVLFFDTAIRFPLTRDCQDFLIPVSKYRTVFRLGGSMNVESDRIRMTERDMEDYLFDHPEQLKGAITHWEARQFEVPSGIIDLLGVNQFGHPVVVELKNVSFESRHLTQVYRYASDIQTANEFNGIFAPVTKILIGPYAPDDKLMIEAVAMQVRIRKFAVDFTMSISGEYYFNQRASEDLETKYRNLANSDEMQNIHLAYTLAENRNKLADAEQDQEDNQNG